MKERGALGVGALGVGALGVGALGVGAALGVTAAGSAALIGGKYRLLEPLARGAMGTIWRAEHELLGTPVAVKLLDERGPLRVETRQRFLQEARTAALLRGPHVVQLLDYGLDGETPYLVMELLAGESLRQRLARDGRLSRRETLRVVAQLAKALGRAEELCIVHRDLSPNNVFLTEEDGKAVAKLLDFGIAKWASEAEPERGLTLNGTILGTPSYMSPEQLEATGRLDGRADIWALGVIAFECLLGHVPFQSSSFPGLVLAICSRPLPVPSRLAKLPQAFDAWFARACARDRELRFASAEDAARELRRALFGR
ncbi:MAG: serine/threonine-protein kinase [Polyangiaceae bacterium]